MSDEQWIITVAWPAIPWGNHLSNISRVGDPNNRPYSVRIGKIYGSEAEANADFTRAYAEEVRPKLDAQMKAMGMENIPSLEKEFTQLIKQHYPRLQVFRGQSGWWISGMMRDGFRDIPLGTDENYVRQIVSGEIVPDWIVKGGDHG